jgi:hypothetical protein
MIDSMATFQLPSFDSASSETAFIAALFSCYINAAQFKGSNGCSRSIRLQQVPLLCNKYTQAMYSPSLQTCLPCPDIAIHHKLRF